MERDLLPKDMWLPEDEWRNTTEQIDMHAAYAVAQKALATIPPVPGTIFVTEDLWVPEGKNAEPFRKEVRRQQSELIAHFTPGKTVTVDAPHAMVPVVPDEIAEATLEMVQQAR